MADISLGELIFGTTEEQQQRKANSILPGYTGVPPTQFEQFISNANAVSAAGTRLRNSGPLNSNYFRDLRTAQLGFSCDTNRNAPTGTTICTGAQRAAIKTYDRGNSNAVVAQRYRDNQVKKADDDAKQIALRPAADYSAEIVRTATPELKESIRRDMIKKGLLHPLETTWNSNAAAQLINYYSGPLTLGSSGADAAQKAAFDAQAATNLALANGASFDGRTEADSQNAAMDSVAAPIIQAQRREAFPVYDALANAVVAQSSSARGPSGRTPVAPPKPPKKVPKKPAPKPKGRRR